MKNSIVTNRLWLRWTETSDTQSQDKVEYLGIFRSRSDVPEANGRARRKTHECRNSSESGKVKHVWTSGDVGLTNGAISKGYSHTREIVSIIGYFRVWWTRESQEEFRKKKKMAAEVMFYFFWMKQDRIFIIRDVSTSLKKILGLDTKTTRNHTVRSLNSVDGRSTTGMSL